MPTTWDDLFEGFEGQGWDDASKQFLVAEFLTDEARRSPELWDRLKEKLQAQADEENEYERKE